MPEVVSVNKTKDPLNPAAMSDTIEKLVAAKYSSPDWVRQGPNFIVNKVTGETVNLNQEATAALINEPVRDDVVAVVADDTGAHSMIWVDQSALHAAGNDLQVLKANLNTTLKTPMSKTTVLLLVGGAALLLYVATKK